MRTAGLQFSSNLMHLSDFSSAAALNQTQVSDEQTRAKEGLSILSRAIAV